MIEKRDIQDPVTNSEPSKVYTDETPEPGIDLNKDGKISKAEVATYEKRARNRRQMAWVALIALVVSGFSLMFLVPETRLTKLTNMLDLYWISLGGIVGAYVGITAWMSKR